MRVLVTGGSGYIGSRLLPLLAEPGEVEEVVDVDLRPPRRATPKVRFVERGVEQGLRDLFAKGRFDLALHLAWTVDPLRDSALQTRICLGGTRSFLEACDAGAVGQVLFLSSATAYGADPGQVGLLEETAPLRPRHHFQYSAEKREAEALVEGWARAHPTAVVQVVRPTVVTGPDASNFIFRTMEASPTLRPAGRDPGIQLVHVDDCAAAIAAIAFSRRPGAFNVTADGEVHLGEVYARLGVRALPAPLPVVRAASAVARWLRLPGVGEAPPGFVSFVAWPWAVSSRRLKEEVGFRFRYDARQTFEAYLSFRAAPAPAARG